MFINISTDQIHIALGEKEYFFDRDNVEKELGPALIQLARESDFTDITVLNGPGGFTNLRVGALCLNMLNTLFDERFSIYDVDKITLYTKLIKDNFLPPKGIIYIGQKKNIWEYDFGKNAYTQMKKSDFFEKKEAEEYFLDLVYADDYFGKETVHITGTGTTIQVSHGNKDTILSMDELSIQPEKYIKANYFIQPILGSQGQ